MARKDRSASRRKAPVPAPRDVAQSQGTRRRLLIATAALGTAAVAAAAIASLTSSREPAPRVGTNAASMYPGIPGDSSLIDAGQQEAAQPLASSGLLAVGASAPDFTLRGAIGESVHMSDYRGKTVVLEFFATWCPHCQAAAPHVVSLYNRLPASVFELVAVSSEEAASVLAFRNRYRIPFATLLDSGEQKGGLGPISRQYMVTGYPTFYVVDRQGRIAWRSDMTMPSERQLLEIARGSER